MNNMFIEIIITHQMLEDSKMSNEERGLLYHHFEKLKKVFQKSSRRTTRKRLSNITN